MSADTAPPRIWWSSEYRRFYVLGPGPASAEIVTQEPEERFMPADVVELRGAAVVLPAVDDLALMLAAADRLWCDEQGDESAEPRYWQAIAEGLDRIVRRNQTLDLPKEAISDVS